MFPQGQKTAYRTVESRGLFHFLLKFKQCVNDTMNVIILRFSYYGFQEYLKYNIFNYTFHTLYQRRTNHIAKRADYFIWLGADFFMKDRATGAIIISTNVEFLQGFENFSLAKILVRHK